VEVIMTKEEAKAHPVYKWMVRIVEYDFNTYEGPGGQSKDRQDLQSVFEEEGGEEFWATALIGFLKDLEAWEDFQRFFRNMPEDWMDYRDGKRYAYTLQRRSGVYAIILSKVESGDYFGDKTPEDVLCK
jgi:hypothetical protein